MGRLFDEDIMMILARHQYADPKVYIETGTWMGTQLLISARHFEAVVGIELDEHWHEVSTQNTDQLNNVHVIHGDTQTELPKLLNIMPKSVFVVLDAHFFISNPPLAKSEFPLWKELQVLKDRNYADIISVDDVHTFGVNREDLRFEQGAVEWESVTEDSILEFMGDRVVDHTIVGDSLILWMSDGRET